MPFDVEHYLGYFAMGLCALSAVGVEGAAPVGNDDKLCDAGQFLQILREPRIMIGGIKYEHETDI